MYSYFASTALLVLLSFSAARHAQTILELKADRRATEQHASLFKVARAARTAAPDVRAPRTDPLDALTWANGNDE